MLDPKVLENFSKMTKSPLGIIGMFITLVYGIAGLVLGFTVSDIPQYLQTIMIVFVVIFPFALLWVFYLLVTNHSGKLYAPIDFRSDEAFHTYRNVNTAEETVLQYDPTLKAEVEKAKDGNTFLSTNPLASIIGKESLAIGAVQRIFESTHGTDNIRRHNTGFGDLIIEKGQDRVHVEVKLISEKSALSEIAAAAARMDETAIFMSNTGRREREFLLYLVIDATKPHSEEIKSKFKSIVKEEKYKFKYEIVTFDEIANNVFS